MLRAELQQVQHSIDMEEFVFVVYMNKWSKGSFRSGPLCSHMFHEL